MAKKLTGLQRVLDVPSLAAVAYGEIGSSLYFALGIIALYALGVTPWLLLSAGALFVLIALSYAEGTAAFPETGGAATFVRRAFNDPLGFLTGWVLFLDYLIVMALAALFTPHYVGSAVGWDAITHEPWDVMVGIGVVAAVAGIRLLRRTSLYRVGIVLAALSLTTHVILVVLGFALVFSPHALSRGVDIGTAPTWHSLAFALPLAMLAYTGLETVANLAAETREPGKTLPRSLFWGIGAVVVVSVLLAIVGISAYPVHDTGHGWTTELGGRWLRAPLVGIASAFDGHLPHGVAETLKVAVGLTGAVVLASAVTTSISGVGRLAYSLARHEMLPHAFARLSRRTLIPPVSIVTAAAMACALIVISDVLGRTVNFLAGLYSFGILLAFAAAQLAVLRLRVTAPDLPRPFRAPGNVRIRGVSLPVAALVGLPLTVAVLGVMVATHRRALVAGAIWLIVGAVVYVTVRVRHANPRRHRPACKGQGNQQETLKPPHNVCSINGEAGCDPLAAGHRWHGPFRPSQKAASTVLALTFYNAAGSGSPALSNARCIRSVAVISGILRAIEISETSICRARSNIFFSRNESGFSR